MNSLRRCGNDSDGGRSKEGSNDSEDSWERKNRVDTNALVDKFRLYTERVQKERLARASYPQKPQDRHQGLYSPECSVTYTSDVPTSNSPSERSERLNEGHRSSQLSSHYMKERMPERNILHHGSPSRSRSPLFPCDEDREVFDIFGRENSYNRRSYSQSPELFKAPVWQETRSDYSTERDRALSPMMRSQRFRDDHSDRYSDEFNWRRRDDYDRRYRDRSPRNDDRRNSPGSGNRSNWEDRPRDYWLDRNQRPLTEEEERRGQVSSLSRSMKDDREINKTDWRDNRDRDRDRHDWLDSRDRDRNKWDEKKVRENSLENRDRSREDWPKDRDRHLEIEARYKSNDRDDWHDNRDRYKDDYRDRNVEDSGIRSREDRLATSHKDYRGRSEEDYRNRKRDDTIDRGREDYRSLDDCRGRSREESRERRWDNRDRSQDLHENEWQDKINKDNIPYGSEHQNKDSDYWAERERIRSRQSDDLSFIRHEECNSPRSDYDYLKSNTQRSGFERKRCLEEGEANLYEGSDEKRRRLGLELSPIPPPPPPPILSAPSPERSVRTTDYSKDSAAALDKIRHCLEEGGLEDLV